MSNLSFHEPVLLTETIDSLVTDPEGIYIDGTLGGGGHTAGILNKLGKDGQIYGIDQDPEALKQVRTQRKEDPRLHLIMGNFGYMDILLPPELTGQVSGILLDLGVSSHQIDEAGRGFSFQEDGPLDMRMGAMTGISAETVVNQYSQEDLTNLIYTYGEERHSRRISNAIVKARPLHTTKELREVIGSVVRGPHAIKSIARVFQAIRIEVNRELEMLELGLKAGRRLLMQDGRFVIISYHSLEDRLVKYFFRSGNIKGNLTKDLFGNLLTDMELLNKKVITASAEEVERNPRARSARMRIGVKTSRGSE
ncbi:MAG TPA: 16S rRNA (cytosine(1402)-N(4))-methyltransferase RsmH [Balneolales bacterium]|nr:16S rRNA (cytosine(1402)-N(4))-methyltransferase RsmH [Balneolales bacterium]